MTLTGRRATIRTVPQPSELNVNGNIFGGWVLSQMDIAGGVVAGRRANGSVATVAIEGMKFHQPIEVGDVVSVYAEVEKVGRTSITVSIDVYADCGTKSPQKVTEGKYIFVAIDKDGTPRTVDAPNT